MLLVNRQGCYRLVAALVQECSTAKQAPRETRDVLIESLDLLTTPSAETICNVADIVPIQLQILPLVV